MAWPQAPQPAPAPPQSSGSSLPLGPLVTAAAGFLTFVFSFVQIVKADSGFSDVGLSVWTTDVGFFGIGTWIPLFALVAAAAALARAFAKGLDAKQVGGFGLLQVQIVAVVFAFLVWLGYMVNILLSDFVTFGLGAFLLFIGLVGLLAGTALSLMDQKKGTTTGISTAPGGPPSGQWGPPSGPQPHSAPQPQQPQPQPQQQWPQPTPPPAPQPDPAQWQQPAPPQDPAQWQQPQPPQQPQQWQQPGAPGQWQPDPAGGQPPPPQGTWAPSPGGPEQAWQPPAAPSEPSPQPQQAPPGPAGGALIDPGTEVIPGPPPAPPAEGQDQGQGGLPPIPPSNTP